MRRAPIGALLRGVLLGLLVIGVSLGVLAMHQVPHATAAAEHAVSQHHEGHPAPSPSKQDSPAEHDTVAHMCVGLIVVIAGLVALALVALVRRERQEMPRRSALRWLRRFPGRAPPHRLTLSELCVLRL